MRALIGTHIRRRRSELGMTQAGLARAVGVSPSYLNLIENNKREIAGGLLLRIAAQLGLDIEEVSGARAQVLLHRMRDIFDDPLLQGMEPAPDDLRQLVASYPAMLRALDTLYRGYSEARAEIEAFADRFNSDPMLGGMLHEVLNRIAGIRSGAEIMQAVHGLSETDRSRFIGAITREAREVSGTMNSLVRYFDQGTVRRRAISPLRDVEDAFIRADSHFPELEAEADRLRDQVLAKSDGEFGEPALAHYLLARHGISCRIRPETGDAAPESGPPEIAPSQITVSQTTPAQMTRPQAATPKNARPEMDRPEIANAEIANAEISGAEIATRDLTIRDSAPPQTPSAQAGGTIWLRGSARYATRQFRLCREIALLEAAPALETACDALELRSAGARKTAMRALASYVAGAMIMPYRDFRAEAEAQRHDIDLLSHIYRASFEQVAHRLVTLRRRGEEGLPFGFLRADAAGRLTKRFPLPGLSLPGGGHGCPLWPVYRTAGAAGTLRQIAEFPNGARFLMIAKSVPKRATAWGEQPLVFSVMLACDIRHASRTVYGSGLDLESGAIAVPVGPACHLCSRAGCGHRQEETTFADAPGEGAPDGPMADRCEPG